MKKHSDIIMPFDAAHHFRGVLDTIANNSKVGSALINPIWGSIVLVATIMLVLVAIDWDGAPTFKLVFYMLAGVCTVMVARDTIRQHRRDEDSYGETSRDLVEGVQARSIGAGSIHPREPETRPENYSFSKDESMGEVTLDQLDTAVI